MTFVLPVFLLMVLSFAFCCICAVRPTVRNEIFEAGPGKFKTKEKARLYLVK
jgi:hypothetical protein